MDTPFIIGVAGGSGSGKTTVTRRVIETVGQSKVAVLVQDNYYRDQSHLTLEQRFESNYDHPAAFDWKLLAEHLDALRNHVPIEMPSYDFALHTRAVETRLVIPAPVIVLEGIFALYEPSLREMMQLKIFVDADADVRFIRRLERDTLERGRSMQSVVDQYLETVRPMHLQFVEPTKRYANVILPHGGHNQPALDMIAARVAQLGLREDHEQL
ncbi:MAG: uridine kinase [Deinococcaceae bacterium]